MSALPDWLASRRERIARAWDLRDEVVLVGAGDFIPIAGYGDRVYPFRPHAEYLYLTDRVRPGCVLAFDPGEGWVDFVPEVTEDERVWMGAGENEGTPLSGLEAWLETRRGRPLAVLGHPVREGEEALTATLREKLDHARRPKDAVEMERMRAAAAATAAGYEALDIGAGRTEREIQIDLEAGFFRAGGDRTAYDTIVAGGPNSAVLHFSPTHRVIHGGELVLIDAGAECDGYACDVSRTYPAGDAFTAEQADLYAIVLAAQVRAIDACRDGVEYRDIHIGAATDMAGGLAEFGLLKGSAESLVESEAISLFFPHGIGHMVGLGVRDASGSLPGRKRHENALLRFLRVDLPLEPDYVLTIEPGLYFIPALLNDPARREQHRDTVDWTRVDRMLDFGGIRIEDNVRVTNDAPEVLTAAIPVHAD